MARMSSNTFAFTEVAQGSRAAECTPVSFEGALETVGLGCAQSTVLIIASLAFMADSIEMSLLSFCSVVLRDEWNLSPVQESLIGFSTFFGGVLGAPFYGMLADKFGRRPVLVFMTAIICIFGFLCAICQELIPFLIFRVIVGTGIGGLVIVLDVLAEITPAANRGGFSIVVTVFWALGTFLLTVLAWLFLEAFGWRVYLAMSAVPALLAFVVCLFALPESPRWLLEVGRHQESLEGLREFARKNGREFNIESLALSHTACDASAALCKSKYLFRLTIGCTVWFCFQAAYAALSMETPRLFETDSIGEGGRHADFNFQALLIVASAELLGTPIMVCVMDKFGRVPLQTLLYSICAILAPFLAIRNLGVVGRIVIAVVLRATLLNATSVSWIHTAELFPTVIRARGSTISCTLGRIGSALVQFSISDSIPQYATLCSISLLCLVAACSVRFHPETRGRKVDELLSSTEDESDESSDESSEYFGK